MTWALAGERLARETAAAAAALVSRGIEDEFSNACELVRACLSDHEVRLEKGHSVFAAIVDRANELRSEKKRYERAFLDYRDKADFAAERAAKAQHRNDALLQEVHALRYRVEKLLECVDGSTMCTHPEGNIERCGTCDMCRAATLLDELSLRRDG